MLGLNLSMGLSITLGLTITSPMVNAEPAGSSLLIKHDFNIEAGLTSQAVTANITAPEALQLLLKGTSLQGHFLDEKTVTVLARNPQSFHSKDALVLDEIYVKGELQSRTIQNTQSSVVVVTGEDLLYRSDNDLLDIFERTPGITRSFGDSAVVIRGIDQNGASSVGGSNGDTIIINVDGPHVGGVGRHNAAVYSTWDLEQIEILRGPQSTQQGRNALAGSIIVRSKDPIYETEVKGRIEAGNYTSRQGALVINTPLITDKLAIRLSADRNQSDRFIDNSTLGTDDFDSEERTTTRFSLRVDPNKHLNAIYKFTHYDAEDGFNDLLRSEFPNNRLAIEDTQSRHQRDFSSHNLRLNYIINPQLKISSKTTYFDAELIQVADADGTANPFGETNLNNNSHSFEQEIRLHYETNKIHAVLGAFYTDISKADDSNLLVPDFLFSPLAPANATISSISTSDTQKSHSLLADVTTMNLLMILLVQTPALTMHF